MDRQPEEMHEVGHGRTAVIVPEGSSEDGRRACDEQRAGRVLGERHGEPAQEAYGRPSIPVIVRHRSHGHEGADAESQHGRDKGEREVDIAMANPENLKGHEFTSDQSREEAARNGRKGGKASGEARRRRKELRVSHDKDGRPITADEAMVLKQLQNALDGDTKAFVVLRDTAGQQPVQRVEVDTIDPQARAEMDELLGLGE